MRLRSNLQVPSESYRAVLLIIIGNTGPNQRDHIYTLLTGLKIQVGTISNKGLLKDTDAFGINSGLRTRTSIKASA